jgi:hypothetical protein
MTVFAERKYSREMCVLFTAPDMGRSPPCVNIRRRPLEMLESSWKASGLWGHS